VATPASEVRAQLQVVTATALAEIAAVATAAPLERSADAALEAARLVIPAFYDATAALALAWYDELRDEAGPASLYVPGVIGEGSVDWIEREVAKFQQDLDGIDFEADMARMVAEIQGLSSREVARGYRSTVIGNTRSDDDAVGWSRIARAGACKFCTMLADRGAVYSSRSSAIFSAHTNCHCGARPEFIGGDHGPEASAIQYVASAKRAKDPAAQAARNAAIRAYLNENYPDLPG